MNGLLGLAFAAGMLAPINPCGFALLPAWIAHTLLGDGTAALPARLARALRAGSAVALGFAAALATAGLVISAGARSLLRAAPALGLGSGLALLVLGLVALIGGGLRLPAGLSARLPGGPDRTAVRSWPGLILVGVGYAAASLSCTVGVLLAVIAQAQATTGWVGLLTVFGVYAAGSAAVLLLVTLSAAAAGATLNRAIGALSRHAPRATAALLILTGGYLTWYWYPAATAGNSATRAGGPARWSAATSTWVQQHSTTVAVLAALLALTAVATVLRRLPAPPAHQPIASPQSQDCCPETRIVDPASAERPLDRPAAHRPHRD